MRAAAPSETELRSPAQEAVAVPRRLDLSLAARALTGLFALQDAIFFVYLAVVGLLVWAAPAGAVRDGCARVVVITAGALLVGCVTGRGLPAIPATLRAGVYRVAIVGVVIANYLTLRDFLLLVRPDSVDEALVRIDLRLFGVEPALWLERWNQRPIIEWFSFFYFSYFGICLVYMLTVVWLSRSGRKTAEYAVGTAIVYCVGQIGYTLVPGYGPITHLKGSFQGDINGGFWWSMVWDTVQAGGAMKDIFPSLHTAAPLWFALFARHQAKTDPRWRWPARITGFFSANIIISTMLLRWHYGIDVLAGLLLAFGTAYLAPRLCAREEAFRASLGHAGPWSFEPARGRD